MTAARHVAIIMDGNGRWAKQRHLPRVVGHQRGVDAVRPLARGIGGLGREGRAAEALPPAIARRPAGELQAPRGR